MAVAISDRFDVHGAESRQGASSLLGQQSNFYNLQIQNCTVSLLYEYIKFYKLTTLIAGGDDTIRPSRQALKKLPG
jgi:hypothetical protein